MNWSEFSGSAANQSSLPRQIRYSDVGGESSRSRRPIMPSDVYPDDYFPRVIKPTPIHYTNSQQQQYTNRYHPPAEESGEEDLMNEALAYRSEVHGPSSSTKLSSGNGDRSQSDFSAATSRLIKSEWETDTRSLSSGMSLSRYSDNEPDKRSPVSVEATSWAAVDGTIQRTRGNNFNRNVQSNSTGKFDMHILGVQRPL